MMTATNRAAKAKTHAPTKRNPPKPSALYVVAKWFGYAAGYGMKFSYRVVVCLFCAAVMVERATRLPE